MPERLHGQGDFVGGLRLSIDDRLTGKLKRDRLRRLGYDITLHQIIEGGIQCFCDVEKLISAYIGLIVF